MYETIVAVSLLCMSALGARHLYRRHKGTKAAPVLTPLWVASIACALLMLVTRQPGLTDFLTLNLIFVGLSALIALVDLGLSRHHDAKTRRRGALTLIAMLCVWSALMWVVRK